MKKTKGQVEAEISEAIIKFEKEYVGRGPLETKTYILDDLVLEAVRLLRDSNLRSKQVQEGLQTRLKRLHRGEGIKLETDETLGTFFDQIEAEVYQELTAGKKKSE